MKGYINKRAKIKYETTPTTPEITGDYLESLVTDSVTLGDLKDVRYLTVPPENGRLLMFQENKWTPSTVYLNNLEDVSIVTPRTGQILQYDQSGYAWKNQDIPNSNWSLIDTVTADGTTASEAITLETPVSSIILDMNMKAAAAQTNLNVNITLTDDTIIRAAAISNGLGTVSLNSKCVCISLGNLLLSLQGAPTQNSSNSIQGRFDTMLNLKSAPSVKIKSIEVAAASGDIPASSEIKVLGTQ